MEKIKLVVLEEIDSEYREKSETITLLEFSDYQDFDARIKTADSPIESG